MHLSILTANGDAVSLTSTINLTFGSKLIDETTGIILNNQMDDFSIPGVPNSFGYAPSPYNYIHPGKRPLSSSCPSFVLDNGEIIGVYGASGGSHIISATAQVIIAVHDWKFQVTDAVSYPRIHHQLIPNVLEIEALYSKKTRSVLAAIGHNVSQLMLGKTFSGVSAVTKTIDGLIHAAGDYRKGGGSFAF